MATDYYRTLGITPDASEIQIKRAHRVLSLRHQADRAGQSGQRRLLEIKEAYEMLSSSTRRAEYHRQLESAPADRPCPSASPLWPKPVDLFGSFASYRPSRNAMLDAFVRGLTGRNIPKSRRLGAINLEIVLSSAEAARGGRLPIDLPLARLCVRCKGTGRTGFFRCDRCDGHGMIWDQSKVEVLVPPGTADGTIIQVSLRHLGVDALALNVHLRVSKPWAAHG